MVVTQYLLFSFEIDENCFEMMYFNMIVHRMAVVFAVICCQMCRRAGRGKKSFLAFENSRMMNSGNLQPANSRRSS